MIVEHPRALVNPPGLIGDIARWVDACAVHPAPILSVASAISVVSTLCGRRYALRGGLRACTYIVGIAQSGVGKEAGRQCAVSLLDRCGLRRRVGTGAIASGAGLVQRLVAHPVQLFLLDEFGRMLDAFSSRNSASHEREIMTTLMTLWSAAPGVFLGKAYAEKEATAIEQPHTVVYGTTTPDPFYGAFRSRDVIEGVLSRMLIFEVDHGQLAEVHATQSVSEPPATLIARCKAVASGAAFGSAPIGNVSDVDLSGTVAMQIIVPLSPAAEAGVRAIGASLTDKLNRATHRDLWVRAREQAMRLALAVAVGCGSAEVAADHLAWAWAVVRWCVAHGERRVSELVADTEEGRCRLAILRAIGEAAGTISPRDLVRSRHLRPYDRRVRTTAVQELLDAGDLVVRSLGVAGNGREAITYGIASPPLDPENLEA